MENLSEAQLDLARDTLVSTIVPSRVERDADGWTIWVTVRASGTAAAILDLGRGPEEVIKVHGVTFVEALDRVIAASVSMIGDPKERHAELLRAAKMQPF